MLKKIMSGAVAALTIGGALMATATPAAAQQWRGGNHASFQGRGFDRGFRGGRGYNNGAVLGAGILGLAVGAALASDRPYYAPGYGYAPAYGAGCTTYTQWDPRFRRYVAVNRCY